MNLGEVPFDHKCRLCLDSEGSPTSSMDDEGFRAKLDAVCNFVFATNDQLPSKVCWRCFSKITEFHEFAETIRCNQEILLSMVPAASIKLETPLKNKVFLESTYEVEMEPTVKLEVCLENEKINESAEAEDAHEDANSINSDSSQKIPDPADDDRLIKQYFSLNCESCSLMFDTFQQLSKHSKKVHKQKPTVQCCSKTFQTKHSMICHINTHLRPFSCDICGKTFSYQQALKLHASMHLASEDKPFKCEKCPRSFITENLLRTHLRSHARAECSVCKKMINVYTMKTHMKNVHSNEQSNFICDVCGKNFKSRSQVAAHRLVHTEPTREDGVRCEICHSWISRKQNLRRHMIDIHESKETECDICHKMYPNLKAMRKHKGIVHVESKFECEVCGKRFKRPLNLAEHRASAHTGQKLYSCEFCGMEMNSNGNLYMHKKNKHPLEWKEAKLKAARLTDDLGDAF